jgi:hypothetical protein
MFQTENWIILCINTIIIIIVLFVLFRQQDTKLRTYIRRIEKKMAHEKPQSNINYEQKNIIPQQKNIIPQQKILQNNIPYSSLNKNEETVSTELMVQQSDMDSFYDPMQN